MQNYLKKTFVLTFILAVLAVCVWELARPNISLSDCFFWTGILSAVLCTRGTYTEGGRFNFRLATMTDDSISDGVSLGMSDLKVWRSGTWHWLGAGITLLVISVFLP